MLTLRSKPSELISKFRLRMGIILLILGSGLLVLGILAVSHTRENVLMHEGIVRRIQDKLAGLSAAPSNSRSAREIQELSDELGFYEIVLIRYKGYFTKAILLLAGGVLVLSGGFCFVYLHRRKMRSLTC